MNSNPIGYAEYSIYLRESQLSKQRIIAKIINMKLTKQEVEKIAKLSRLELSDSEKEKYAEQLSAVLEYVGKLEKVNTDNVEMTAQVTGLENVYRDDKVKQVDYQKELIKQAAESEDNLIKTKSVF